MSAITFADVVHYSVSFSRDDPAENLVLQLLDTPWVQRLRDISQTANTRLVYMFSEHSRFGHSVGVAYMAKLLLDKLARQNSDEVAPYRAAVMAAALLHDLGHLAPGSHTAYKAWFPNLPDQHEAVTVRIVNNDPRLQEVLTKLDPRLPKLVAAILAEDQTLPPWTWEIVSGGGWNVDRGNWCIVDSIMAGVTYGRYNIPALTEAITITNDKHLALNENRLDAMTHFVISRHAMYRQLYQHRVLLAADTLNLAIVARARALGRQLNFFDATMEQALAAKRPDELTQDSIFAMRESWWRYHLGRWLTSSDKILADLSDRLLNRRLLKTIRVPNISELEDLRAQALKALKQCGLDPNYYLHSVRTANMHSGDRHQSMLVQMEDGRLLSLAEAEPLFASLVNDAESYLKAWLVLPSEAKQLMGRTR